MTKLYTAEIVAQLEVEVKCRINSTIAAIPWFMCVRVHLFFSEVGAQQTNLCLSLSPLRRLEVFVARHFIVLSVW